MDSETLYAAGLLAYDGTEYHGFQYQTGVATVQGALERALEQFAEPLSRVVAAGRTDAGVHANGQVIAVMASWRHGPAQLQQAWNAHLPSDICVRGMVAAPEDFHPRFSAEWRTYRYRVIANEGGGGVPKRSPMTDRYAWFVGSSLDVQRMQAAASVIVGEHDFATFGQPTQGDSTVRTVAEACWQLNESTVAEMDAYPGVQLVFTIRANGFLRQMVRTVVNTLVEIGLGRRSVDEMQALLRGKDRKLSAAPAPACGLTLERVDYPVRYSIFA